MCFYLISLLEALFLIFNFYFPTISLISNSILGISQPGEFIFQCPIFCLFILFMGFLRQEYWSVLPFPSPVEHVLWELSTMTCPSWVALHGMARSFHWVKEVFRSCTTKPSRKDFEHNLTVMQKEHQCTVFCPFFGTVFLWDYNENWPFPVLWPLLSLPDLLVYWVQYFISTIF